MADIFISYARVDRDRARALADALVLEGWSVWWDRDIPPGRTFDDVIEEALSGAKCVIVLWSRDSVRSEWVKAEASDAARRRILVPVLADEVTPPLEFRRIQSAALLDWGNLAANPDWSHLCKALGSLSGQQSASTAPDEAERVEQPAPTNQFVKRPEAQGWTRAIAAAGAFFMVVGVVWAVLSRPSASAPPAVAESPVTLAPEPKRTGEPASAPTEPDVPAPSSLVATGVEGPLARAVGRRPAPRESKSTAPSREVPSASNAVRAKLPPVPDAEQSIRDEVAPVAVPAASLVPSVAPAIVAPSVRTTGATAFDVAYTRGVFHESGRLTVSSDGLRYAEANGRSALDAACGDLRRVQVPTMIVDGAQRMVELQMRERVLRFTLADTAARNGLIAAISQACGAR